MCGSGLDAGCLGEPSCRAQLQVTCLACLCGRCSDVGCCVKTAGGTFLSAVGRLASTPSVMSPDVCAQPQRVAWHVLRARLMLCSVYFTSVSDSCYSSVSLLRNKILTVWIACLRSRAVILVKTKQLCISNRMQIFLCSFKNSTITTGDSDSLHGFPSVAVSDEKWFCCIYWPVCARITTAPSFLNVAAVYLDKGVFKIRHWEVLDIS